MTEHNGLSTVLCSIASSSRVVKSVHPGEAIGTICEDTKKRNADGTLHPSIDFWNRIMSSVYPLWQVCMKAPVACCDENVSTWVKPQSLVNSGIAWWVVCFFEFGIIWFAPTCSAGRVLFLSRLIISCLEVTQGLGLLSWSTCATIMPCSVAPRSQILFQKGLMMTRLPRGLFFDDSLYVPSNAELLPSVRLKEGIIKGHIHTTSACVVKVFLWNNESLKTMTQGTQKENSWIKCTREGPRGSVLVQFSVA